eukprot:4722149-Pyramimonas_sp.AAC.1
MRWPGTLNHGASKAHGQLHVTSMSGTAEHGHRGGREPSRRQHHVEVIPGGQTVSETDAREEVV